MMIQLPLEFQMVSMNLPLVSDGFETQHVVLNAVLNR